MTNKEWLMSLTDRELAEWLCDCYIIRDREGEYDYTGLRAVKVGDAVKNVTEWLGRETKGELK